MYPLKIPSYSIHHSYPAIHHQISVLSRCCSAYSVPDPPDCAFSWPFPPTVLKEDNVELLVVKHTAILPPLSSTLHRSNYLLHSCHLAVMLPASRQGLRRHINTSPDPSPAEYDEYVPPIPPFMPSPIPFKVKVPVMIQSHRSSSCLR